MDRIKSCKFINIIITFIVILGIIHLTRSYADADITTRVSVDTNGTEMNFNSLQPDMSDDGRYIAFHSVAALTTGDTNGFYDVFVHDKLTGVTEIVSVNNSSVQGNNNSFSPSISGDGRYVAFHSYAANLVTNDTNNALDVFVHDRQTHNTYRVSVGSVGFKGAQANGASSYPSITDDGRYVAFHSRASNLVINDTNNKVDIFVHDRQTSLTNRVSVNGYLIEGNGDSYNASISNDGRYVVFYSHSTNFDLTRPDYNGKTDVFIHDREADSYAVRTKRISVGSCPTAEGNGNSYTSGKSSISGDGHYVVYFSDATNLDCNIIDSNGTTDVFFWTFPSGNYTASLSSTDIQGNNVSTNPSISDDGRYVAFQSISSNLVANDANNKYDVFVRDTQYNTTTRMSQSSLDIEGNGDSISAAISDDGRYVAFQSISSNLVSGDTNTKNDIFVRHPEPNPAILDIANNGADDRNIDLAYNSSENQFISVWESNGFIMGEIRGGDGSIIKDDFTILPLDFGVTYVKPKVTYKSTQNIYFIVTTKHVTDWNNKSSQIIGIRLSATGNILGTVIPITPQFKRSPIYEGSVSEPNVVADTMDTNCCILVAWHQNHVSTSIPDGIIGQVFNADGSLSGSNFWISGPHGLIELTYQKNPNDDFLLIYKDNGGEFSPGAIGRIIIENNGIVSAPLDISESSTYDYEHDLDVAYNEISGTYLVVWNEIDNINGKIVGQRLNSAGDKIGNNFLINGPNCILQYCSPTGNPSVAAATNNGNFLVTYYDSLGYKYINSRQIDNIGNMGSETRINFDSGGFENHNPAIIYVSTPMKYMIAWESEFSQVSAADINGILYDPLILTVNKVGTGSGTVTSTPTGINCGTDCSESYPFGTVVTLTNASNPDSIFTGWNGACTGIGSCTVTMDAAKTVTATFSKVRYEEVDPVITYTGTWINYNCSACSGGKIKISNQTGAKATFTFTGTGVKWFAAKANQLGIAKVYIDNVFKSNVDLYNATTQVKQMVYQNTGLNPGVHSITIEVSGTKNASSNGYYIDIDVLEIIP